jgi:hypothetical protein
MFMAMQKGSGIGIRDRGSGTKTHDSPSGPFPAARSEIVEPNQVNLVAATMLRNVQQLFHAAETRLACKILRDVPESDRDNRINDYVPLVHTVSTARLDVRPLPDSDATPDSPASNPVAKVLGEHHGLDCAVNKTRFVGADAETGR